MTAEQEYRDMKHDKILGKVRGLLATADHPNTPPEMAETYRTQAELLMTKYRIEEATVMVNLPDGYTSDDRYKPVWRSLTLCGYTSEFAEYYRRLANMVAYHVEARGITKYEDGDIILEMVGYKADLEYGDMILTACLLEFGKRLEPKYDPARSNAENAWLLRSAGWERKRIAKVMFGDWTTENEMKAKNRKVTALIKAHCDAIGEDWNHLLGRGNNIAQYRKSYADGFVDQMTTRLYRLRAARGEEGKAVVLQSRKENVDEAFYDRFPTYRPSTDVAKPYVDPRANCPKCQQAKSGYCREHLWLKPSNAMPYDRTNYRARERGADAARAVDLGRGATGTSRMRSNEKKEIS